MSTGAAVAVETLLVSWFGTYAGEDPAVVTYGGVPMAVVTLDTGRRVHVAASQVRPRVIA